MEVVLVKYHGGNLRSVENALRRLGVSPTLSDDAQILQHADRVILPGQGEASRTMADLRARGLDKVICDLKQPVLGICIGMQLFCRHSDEGDTDCLDIFDVPVKKFVPNSTEMKVPHMGWNALLPVGDSETSKEQTFNNPLLRGVNVGDYVYFVHSYYAPLCAQTVAVSDYAGPFSAVLHQDNFWATQFHPEKSGEVGAKILRNFIEMRF